jgi:hypothetical protein
MEETFDMKLELELIARDIEALREQVVLMEDPASFPSNIAYVRYDPVAVYNHVEIIKGHVEALELMLYPQGGAE